MSTTISSSMLQQGVEYCVLEADIKYYQDPLFDRFREHPLFRKSRRLDDPHSLQSIIWKKEREQLRVANYTKCLEKYRQRFEFTDFDEYIEFIFDYYPDDSLENYNELEEYTENLLATKYL